MTRRLTALFYGSLCHLLFAAGVGGMVVQMYFGLQHTFGTLTGAVAWGVNLALLLQFPLVHSALLTGPGRALLARLGPAPHGRTLATTTYATIAGAQLLLLFVFWSYQGPVLYAPGGVGGLVLTALYLAAWGLLGLSILTSGWRLQSGALGWMALWRGREPQFPDMPTSGLYRLVRQPIYVSFALTLWTTPVMTRDQLVLAVVWTAYCLIAPLHKERRFSRIHGARFERYKARVPYWFPLLRKS